MASETLSFAEAVCTSVEAEEYFIQTRILEEENFLAVLRRKADSIANKAQEAQRQLQEVQDAFPFMRTDPADPLGKAHHMAVHAAYLGAVVLSSDDDNEDDSGGDKESGVGDVSEEEDRREGRGPSGSKGKGKDLGEGYGSMG